jgi:protease PrsW
MSDLAARLGAGVPNLDRVKEIRSYAFGRVLLGGLALWGLAMFVTLVTGAANLLPAVIILGGCVVPVSFMTWAYDRRRPGELTFPLLVKAFMAGGLVGLVAAMAVEFYFVSPSPFLYVGAALVGEAVKIVVLAYVARGLTERSIQQGMVLGATVGFGFAAIHTIGYGLNALITVDGMSIRDIAETELLRGVIAPVGPALWTAIIGGVLFATSQSGRWRLTSGLLLSYLGVSLLQAMWDATHNIAVMFTLLSTGTPWQFRLMGLGYLPRPTDLQLHLFTAATFAGYALIAAIGVLWLGILRRQWLQGGRPQPAQQPVNPAKPVKATKPVQAKKPAKVAKALRAKKPVKAAKAAPETSQPTDEKPGQVPQDDQPQAEQPAQQAPDNERPQDAEHPQDAEPEQPQDAEQPKPVKESTEPA